MNRTVSPQQLYHMINDDIELALIDVREQGEYATSHILSACCIPLSHMEIRMPEMVFRPDTRIVLVADRFSEKYHLLQRAAAYLQESGYRDISALEGGVEGWQQSGYLLFSGVNTLSKAFGEFIEATCHTPRIENVLLKQKMDLGEKIIIFDARPEEEYRRVSIPGASNLPGAELVYRFFEIVTDPEALVVINCAGRTRSIIGAQSLINAGVPNRVMALKNGTMGWDLAGFELDHDRTSQFPIPSAVSVAAAAACARNVAKRYGVQRVDYSMLLKWKNEIWRRNLYILDVRSPEEFRSGHLPGSKNAPGGQLVQATDEYVAVRKARLVLVDDNEIRATMTASWLVQMGWEDVFVLSEGIGQMSLEKGPSVCPVSVSEDEDMISMERFKTLLDSQLPMAIIDFASSREYKAGHIPGAGWMIRSRLAVDFKTVGMAERVVLTSPDGVLASLAAKDLKASAPDLQVMVLQGGTDAWVESGLLLEAGMTCPFSQIEDVWYKPYERENDSEASMKTYLEWEVGLLDQIEKEGTVSFRKR